MHTVTCIDSVMDEFQAHQGEGEHDQAFDLEDILKHMAGSQILDHEFWSEVRKAVPPNLVKDMDRYSSLKVDLAGLIRFVFGKHKIGATCTSDPSSDDLKNWTSCDDVLRYYDPDGVSTDKFKDLFIKVATDELNERSIAAYRSVSSIVQGCINSASSLGAMATSLQDVKNHAMLGKDGPWASILASLLKAMRGLGYSSSTCHGIPWLVLVFGLGSMDVV